MLKDRWVVPCWIDVRTGAVHALVQREPHITYPLSLSKHTDMDGPPYDMNGHCFSYWFVLFGSLLTDPTGRFKGVYPQSEGSLAIVGIDALKGFVYLWVHFFVGIVDIHQNGYRQKVLLFGFD